MNYYTNNSIKCDKCNLFKVGERIKQCECEYDDTEEPIYIIPTNKMHKCSTSIRVGFFEGVKQLRDLGLKVKHKKGAMGGIVMKKIGQNYAPMDYSKMLGGEEE